MESAESTTAAGTTGAGVSVRGTMGDITGVGSVGAETTAAVDHQDE